MNVVLGTQGWRYRAWNGSFYPSDLGDTEMLRAYARQFNTVEVDETFYGLPPEPLIREWKDAVPDSFTFAFKVPQQITHDRRLAGAEDLLQRFIDRIRLFETNLGPLLLQLSPDFLPTTDNIATLEAFLQHLNRDLRWSVEFRHQGWFTEAVFSMRRWRGVALTLADNRWMRRERLVEMTRDPTARFLYVRWMDGASPLSGFDEAHNDRTTDLEAWATAFDSVSSRVETIYGYFNNRFAGHGPHSVRLFDDLLQKKESQPTRR